MAIPPILLKAIQEGAKKLGPQLRNKTVSNSMKFNQNLAKNIDKANKKLTKDAYAETADRLSPAMQVSGYRGKGVNDQMAKNWTKQNVSKGTGSILRDKATSPMQKLVTATAENAGASALGAGTMIGGAGAYGIYNMIQNWINSGELDEDFEEADLERLMMEAGYDTDALDDQGEMYEGDNEDEMFLRSYVRGGQTGLRNEQGDFMTAQEAKDELEKLYGKK